MIRFLGFGTREEKAESKFETLLNSEQFKCSRCKNPLSVAPILALENKDLYCGRCKDAIYENDSNPKVERQILYEVLAELIQFPCRYESAGCKELLEWEQVEEHEKTCKFREMRCFFNLDTCSEEEQCNWNGECQHYFEHIEEKHKEGPSGINQLKAWDICETLVFRFDFLHQALVAVLLFINGVYYFTLIGNDEEPAVEYTIEIEDEKRKSSRTFRQYSTFLPHSFNNRNFGTKLRVTDFKPKYLSVYFGGKNNCTNECNAKFFPSCDICQGNMVAPIFTCESDHKTCENCWKIGDKCKFPEDDDECCRELSESKYLWKKYQREHYECRNPGCYYHGNFLEMKSHNQFCTLELFHIPVLNKLNVSYPIDSEEPIKYRYKFNKHIFSLWTSKREDSIECTLISLKMSPKAEYKFQMTIFNSSSSVLTFPIFPVFYDFITRTRIYPENSIVIPLSLINQDGPGDITFKLNISKV